MAVPSNKSPLSTSRVRKPAAPKKNTPVPSVFVAVIKGNLPESSTTAEPPDPKKAHPPMTGAVIQNVISHDASVITTSVVPSVNSHETVRVETDNDKGGFSSGKNVPVSGIGLKSQSLSGFGSK